MNSSGIAERYCQSELCVIRKEEAEDLVSLSSFTKDLLREPSIKTSPISLAVWSQYHSNKNHSQDSLDHQEMKLMKSEEMNETRYLKENI